MLSPPPKNDRSSYSMSSRDRSYHPGATSSVRSTDYYDDCSLSPERPSALERLIKALPFDCLRPRSTGGHNREPSQSCNNHAEHREGSLGLEQASKDLCEPKRPLNKSAKSILTKSKPEDHSWKRSIQRLEDRLGEMSKTKNPLQISFMNGYPFIPTIVNFPTPSKFKPPVVAPKYDGKIDHIFHAE